MKKAIRAASSMCTYQKHNPITLGACRRSVGEARTSKYYSERGAMKEHSGATRLRSNEVQNNIFRSQAIKCFSDRLLVPAIVQPPFPQ